MMDERKDKGEFYPGGGRAGVTPERPYMGKVDCVNLSEIGESYTLRAVKEKLDEVVRAMAPSAICLAVNAIAVISWAEVTPLNSRFEDIPGNAQLMTNVQAYVDAKVAEAEPGNYGAVSNAAMNAAKKNDTRLPYTEDSPDGMVTFLFRDYIYARSFIYSDSAAEFKWGLPDDVPDGISYLASTGYVDRAIAEIEIPAPDLSEYAKLYTVSALANFATNADVKASTAIAYLQGDDAKVVVTNYDSAVEMPTLSFKQRVEDGGTNFWKVIWDEATRWNWLTGTYLPANYYGKSQIDVLLDEKADRAWGYYDSHTGSWAPDGYTWISSPKIAIAAGLAYQRTVTSEGAIWVLESNGLVTETGGDMTNGFFRVRDDEGNSLLEIVKGSKRTIGAEAGSARTELVMGVTHLFITYAVVSESHPTLKICPALELGEWSDETSGDCVANVSWTGTSGNYVAEVWGKTALPRIFVKAEYEVGSETYIKNTAPISADGGILCTDGVHKVRPVYSNGNITWEVVP